MKMTMTRQQTFYSQNSTNENEGPIEYMNQMLKLENTRRYVELYGMMLEAINERESSLDVSTGHPT